VSTKNKGGVWMATGTVKWFKDTYGFITGQDGRDYFVHFSQIEMEGYRTLMERQKVEFEPEFATDKGWTAKNVKIIIEDN